MTGLRDDSAPDRRYWCWSVAYLSLLLSRGSQLTSVRAGAMHGRVIIETSPSIGWYALYRPCRRPTIAQFIPWKARVKSMLEETIQEVVDECDLGPAVGLDRLIMSARIELATPLLSKRVPLAVDRSSLLNRPPDVVRARRFHVRITVRPRPPTTFKPYQVGIELTLLLISTAGMAKWLLVQAESVGHCGP